MHIILAAVPSDQRSLFDLVIRRVHVVMLTAGIVGMRSPSEIEVSVANKRYSMCESADFEYGFGGQGCNLQQKYHDKGI